jgi:predicted RNA-binding protein with PUA domain
MDQNNFNRIHTSVRRILIYKYAKELSEDQVYSIIVKKKVYSINKFSVASDAWSYRTTRQG